MFERLAERGVPTGYVDLDQLGMCYPPSTTGGPTLEPASDHGRHRLQARNLDAVAVNLRAAGARCLVVSGVVDAVRGADLDLVPHGAVTVHRLRCDPAELRRRLLARGRNGELVEAELSHADALDQHQRSGSVIDTTGLQLVEVLQQVEERAAGWPGPAVLIPRPGGAVHAGVEVDDVPAEILWLCGATAVGKSTVGWEIYDHVQRAGFAAAFVDLAQLGFYRPAPVDDPGNHRLRARNLSALGGTFAARGAQRLVVVGSVDQQSTVETYRAVLPAASLPLVRLDAGPDRLAERIRLRGQGEGPPIPGDGLTGQPPAVLRRVAEQAAAEAEALQRSGVGDIAVDTDGRSVADVARDVLARTRFLEPRPAVR